MLCAGLALALGCCAHAETLHIGSWDRKTDRQVLVGEAVLTQAYAELGQPVEFVEYPIRRAMVMMLNGELDGNVFRIAALGSEQPSLYRVETPVNVSEVRLYSADPQAKATSWSQLNGVRVAYQRGALLVERNLPPQSQRVEAGSVVELFRLLSHGVADVALTIEPGQGRAHPLAATYGITRSDHVLERTPLHHYLLGKHREIGQQLNAVLKRMASSGEMQAITVKALKTPD